MKILTIIPWIPYPLNSGGNQGVFNMIEELRKEHDISIILHPHNSEDKYNIEELKKVWSNVTLFSFNEKNAEKPYSANLKGFNKIKYNLFTKIEASFQRKCARLQKRNINSNNCKTCSKEEVLGKLVQQESVLHNRCADITPAFLKYVYNISNQGYDLVQVEFYEYLPLIYALPKNIRKVFVHHEIRFVRNENEMSLFCEVSLKDKIVFEKQKDEELAALARYNDIIVMSDIDNAILKHYLPNNNIYTSPSTTDAFKHTKIRTPHCAQNLAFVGSGGHFPNVDGLLWFSMFIWPLLQEKGYNDSIYVTGKWKEDIKSIITKHCNRIRFVGYIDDLQTFLSNKISIVPIRIGSGMRMKIMDAMSAMSPMVTTSKGCEGIPLVDGTDCFIKDDAEEFADAIIKIANDEALQKSMAESVYKQSKGLMDASVLLQRRMNFYK